MVRFLIKVVFWSATLSRIRRCLLDSGTYVDRSVSSAAPIRENTVSEKKFNIELYGVSHKDYYNVV